MSDQDAQPRHESTGKFVESGANLYGKTKNLKLVQRTLNHADIKITTKYAHVVDDEVAAGLEAMQKSRRKSRKPVSKAS